MSRGKKTYYPFKTLRPVTANFTEQTRVAMAKIQAKGPSCSDIQEHALRKLAGLPTNADLDKLIEALNTELGAPVIA